MIEGNPRITELTAELTAESGCDRRGPIIDSDEKPPGEVAR